jgi:Zn-dependent protease
MFRSWRLGKLFGIPLYLHPTFLLLPAWVFFASWGEGLFFSLFVMAVALATLVCLVLHELGHALMARAFGIGTRDITLYPIGGVARLERMSEQPAEEIAIALAGPAVNLVIALLLLVPFFLSVQLGLLGSGQPVLGEGFGRLAAKFSAWLMGMNVVLLLFNLLPIFPMDGGRVFRAILALGVGRLRATEVAAAVGAALAVGLGLVFTLGPLFSGGFPNPLTLLLLLFIILMGRMELYMVRAEERQRSPVVAAAAPAARPADEPASPGFTGFRWDPRYHAWVRWQNGRPVEVYGGAE